MLMVLWFVGEISNIKKYHCKISSSLALHCINFNIHIYKNFQQKFTFDFELPDVKYCNQVFVIMILAKYYMKYICRFQLEQYPYYIFKECKNDIVKEKNYCVSEINFHLAYLITQQFLTSEFLKFL